MAGVLVQTRGLREFRRDLGRADKTLRKEVDAELKTAAAVVTVEAKSIAEGKSLRESGDLIRSIKPFVRGGTVGVAASARHGGYPYPGRLEYEGRAGGKTGPRAFLNPAVDRKEKQIVNQMEMVLDSIVKDLES